MLMTLEKFPDSKITKKSLILQRAVTDIFLTATHRPLKWPFLALLYFASGRRYYSYFSYYSNHSYPVALKKNHGL